MRATSRTFVHPAVTRGRRLAWSLAAPLVLALAAFGAPAPAAGAPFIAKFHTIVNLGSTVPTSGPGAGDQNPYGTAVVPRTTGSLRKGDVLVSNFNDGTNQQGTGSTIVEVSPSSRQTRVFAHIPSTACAPSGGVGLTTALVALRNGDVVVGSLPAPGGTIANAGCLIVVDSSGAVVKTFSGGHIQGPWDMTSTTSGGNVVLFFSNVLTGKPVTSSDRHGTVVRMVLRFTGSRPRMVSQRVIATGFREHLDPSALVIGPTGVGLGRGGTLYVADTAGNRIAAVPNALTRRTAVKSGGTTVSKGGALNGPLGLAIAPGGDILTVNSKDGRILETTPAGRQVVRTVLVGTQPKAADGAGDLFGLAVAGNHRGVYFVDDAGMTTPSSAHVVGAFANSLELLR